MLPFEVIFILIVNKYVRAELVAVLSLTMVVVEVRVESVAFNEARRDVNLPFHNPNNGLI